MTEVGGDVMLMRKWGSKKHAAAEKRADVRDHRNGGLSVSAECRLISLAHATDSDAPKQAAGDPTLVEALAVIGDTFEVYGWRHVQREVHSFLVGRFRS